MSQPLRASAQKVQTALEALGLSLEVVELPDTTRSAQEAAEAIGCRVEQIVKSLVFRGVESGRPILVLASGRNRVDQQKLADLVGEAVKMPDAQYVRSRTGFVIGGVPPLGHTESLETYIDQDLMDLNPLWAAAGTPFAVFSLAAADLLLMTGGRAVSITRDR